MATMEPLCHLIGINSKKFSKNELILLEMELFVRICDGLKDSFKQQYKNFFKLMQFTIIKENEMLEQEFIRIILHDILATKEYTTEGIAHYTNIHKDVIDELASGLNTKPLATYLRKVVELHRTVRSELYRSIAKKIITEYVNTF